jgi:hypothetical protein
MKGKPVTTYTEAVAEARQLVKRSEEDQWRLAELTWEQVEAGKSRRQWAKDIGVSDDSTQQWYLIWQYKIEKNDDVGTFADVRAVVRGAGEGESLRQMESVRTVRNLPPERKAEVARELLNEPAVREAVEDEIADSPAAVARVNQEAERRRPTPSRHTAERTGLSAAASLTALEAVTARLHDVATEVFADVMDGKADPALLAEPIKSIAIDLRLLQEAMKSSTSIDTALADILNGDER